MLNNSNSGKILLIFGISLIIVSCVLQIVMSYHVDKDVTDWKTRAQVAGDIDQMYPYLENLESGMENYGMTEGHAAIIFKRPENDMTMIYESVVRIKNQAEKLKGLDRNSEAYYQGFDDIRGRLRELNLHAPYFYLIHDAVYMLILLIAGLALAVVGFLLQIRITEIINKNLFSLFWIFFILVYGGFILGNLPIGWGNLFYIGMFIIILVLSPGFITGSGCFGGICSNEFEIARQKYDEAEKIYRRYYESPHAVNMYPDVSKAYEELFKNGNYKKSIEYSQKIIDKYNS